MVFHRVPLMSLTDGLTRSLNSLRFPVVAAQSKNECAQQFLFFFFVEEASAHIRFFSDEIGGVLQVTQNSVIDPKFLVRLLAEIEKGARSLYLINRPCSTFSKARMVPATGLQPLGAKSTIWGFPCVKVKDQVLEKSKKN